MFAKICDCIIISVFNVSFFKIPDLTNIEYYNRIIRRFTENKKKNKKNKNKKNKKTIQCRKTKKGSKKRCPIIETESTDDSPSKILMTIERFTDYNYIEYCFSCFPA